MVGNHAVSELVQRRQREFRKFRGWLDSRFPWSMYAANGNSKSMVYEPISAALDNISEDFDDTGSRFWAGYRTITDALQYDLRYCKG